ncbi:TetR/AcrR family transcriptional regulator [Lichenicola sp.]|uniref:TetR/AcrR family transcriptional regulator n=1 Tax=Lichenicola sp. TaxID=2804529 RepID=UPI003B00B5FF
MLETAITLMQEGQSPSVSDVAEAAGVSRATSYRYFPNQADLVNAVVDAALGPILDWLPRSPHVEERVADLMEVSLRRIGEFEATFRAALKLSLDQWAKTRAGTLGLEAPLSRGHRIELLRNAVAPLHGAVGEQDLDRLAKGLSLVFGIEAFVVLKDIWKMEQDEVERTIIWVAQALLSSVSGVERGGAKTGR